MSFIERFDEILEEVSQHDASLIMEDTIINDSIDMFFVETADDSLVGSSKVTSPHYIVMRQKLKKLVKLHRELNTFTPKDILKYSGDDWMDRCREYSYMSPEEFQRVHGGTCWEYAQYQYIRLKDMGYNTINFYIEIDDSEVNHTFTIVKERNKYIYLESYLDECRGIYVADHIADIFTLVTSKLSEYIRRRIGYKIHIYHGYDNYGCDYFVFKEHMKSQKVVAKGNISYMDKKVPNVQMLEDVNGFITESEDESKLKKSFKTKKAENFEFMDLSEPNVDKYLLQDEWCKKWLKNIHKTRSGEIVINKVDDKLAGYCFVYKNTEWKGYICPLFIVEKYRGYGLSDTLVEDAIKKYGATHLNVYKDNEVAIYIYKKHGFKIRGDNGDVKSQYVMSLDDEYLESSSVLKDDHMLVFEAAIEHSFYLKEVVEKNIFETLDMPDKKKKFKRIQDEYINRNIDKLSTAGPQYLIVFGDTDQKAYYDLFGIRKEEIIAAMKKVTSSSGSGSEFKFLTQNPILVVLYFCIRYFTINKDQSSLNGSLSIYALAIYWSIFTKYFKHGVIGPVMEYTIDNLTEKFMIKKAGNIFNTLNMSIRQSYEFHKKRFFEGGDDDITAFAQRIRNDQNSLIKKIANEYMKNYKDGNAVVTRNDNYDSDKPILDDVDNASTIIQNQVSKVTLPIISDGVDLVLAEAAAKLAEISVSDCREYLIKILVQKNLDRLEDLIEGLLFMFIYTDKRTVRDIKSQLFLVWGASLFKKTNSKDPNLAKVNRILEEWAIESGIYARYNRPGTRINYKKGILFYIILSIQKNS